MLNVCAKGSKLSQMVELQSDIDTAYRDCFGSAGGDFSVELASSAALQGVTEASFGNLGRTDPEVCHLLHL